MSFHLTAEEIRVEDNHVLFAYLRNDDGELVESRIDLNEHLGNDNGMFLLPRCYKDPFSNKLAPIRPVPVGGPELRRHRR